MDAKLAISLSLIACVLNIIDLAIPYWLAASKSKGGRSVSVNMGLLSMCVHVGLLGVNVDECFAYDDQEEFGTDSSAPTVILETRYIQICASILMCTSTIWGVGLTVLQTPTVLYTKPSGVNAIIAGILALVGCIVFATSSDIKELQTLVTTAGSDFHEHAGFALCIVAGVLSLGSGVLYILARKDTRTHSSLDF